MNTDETNKVQNQTQTAPLIVIVEDDRFLSKMYTDKFQIEGFNVLTAADGEEGLNLILEKKPKLVILDMMLPKSSGYDLLVKLRKDPYGKNVPVIALTNLAQKDEAKKALELGAKEYLVKAMYTPDEVIEKVKHHLS